MRVLKVINTLDFGGAETLLCDLAPSLMRLGVHVDILCLSARQYPLEEKLVDQGIKPIHTGYLSAYSPLNIWRIRKQILTREYDIIHSHLFPAQLWTSVAAEAAKVNIPLVTTEHNTWNRRRHKWFLPLDRWMYARYSAIACIGPTTERALQEWMADRKLPTSVVYNGIDLRRFACSEGTISRRQDRQTTTLICVGSLNERKGQEILLHAVSLLPGTEVLLVGDGPRRPDLERLAGDLGIVDRVQFLGNRRDIPELLKEADIYVQPSHWDGFGIAALEAMAARLPVVASNVPGLSEVVGDAGVLFEKGSVVSLKERLLRLIRDKGLRVRLGAKAEARSQRFSVDATASGYLRLYESVLGSVEHPSFEVPGSNGVASPSK